MTHKMLDLVMAQIVGFWLKGGVPEPQDGHTTLYTPCSCQLLVMLSRTKCQHYNVRQYVKRWLFAKCINQHHYTQLNEAGRELSV